VLHRTSGTPPIRPLDSESDWLQVVSEVYCIYTAPQAQNFIHRSVYRTAPPQ